MRAVPISGRKLLRNTTPPKVARFGVTCAPRANSVLAGTAKNVSVKIMWGEVGLSEFIVPILSSLVISVCAGTL